MASLHGLMLSVFDPNHPPQVMYCSSECRQAAADQYHRVLCLGPSQEDPDHPVNKIKDAWRWDILYGWGELLFIIKLWFSLVKTTPSLQEYALPPRDLQHHADGQNGRCRQTGETLNWLEFSFDSIGKSTGVLTNVWDDQTVATQSLCSILFMSPRPKTKITGKSSFHASAAVQPMRRRRWLINSSGNSSE